MTGRATALFVAAAPSHAIDGIPPVILNPSPRRERSALTILSVIR